MNSYERILNPHRVKLSKKVITQIEQILEVGHNLGDLVITRDGNVTLNYSKIEEDSFTRARNQAIQKGRLSE